MMISRYVVFILVAFFSTGVLASVEILKSPSDKREYEYFQLPNQMKVIVVSDPDTDKAAASLNVRVGSFKDPVNRQGLSHFLEHMLFLGTDKYPDPDSYRNFMLSHGGSDNAYTSSEHTVYFFELDKNYLHDALDRFSQFFISPRFNKDLVNQEMKAVESEYRLKIKDDSRRMYEVMKETSNPDHAFTKFSVGNLTTFSDENGGNIHKDLINYYNKNYSANIMTLTIVGKESIPALKKWVEELFSPIKNKNLTPFSTDIALFNDDQKGIRIDYIPIKDVHKLTFSFPMPWKEEYRLTKPDLIIAHLLGHEGEGSLYAMLKSKGWVNSLSAGRGLMANNYSTFEIDMDLTDEGWKHIDDIGKSVFQYLSLVRKTGIQDWVFDEIRRMNDINFNFSEKRSASSESMSISNNLHYYKPALAVKAAYHLEAFDKKQIHRVFKYLKPRYMRLFVVGKELEPATSLVSKWYSAPYHVRPLTDKERYRWRNHGENSELSIPARNIFLPTDISIKSLVTISNQPIIIMEKPGVIVWHKQDSEFKVPRNDIHIDIQTKKTYSSIRNSMLTNLYVALINDALNEFAYPAMIAGLHYSVHSSGRGIAISLGGYNDKQDVMLAAVLDKIINLKVSPDRFLIKKEKLLRHLENSYLDRPFQQTMRHLSIMLRDNRYIAEEKIKAVNAIKYTDIETFKGEVFSDVRLQVFSHGNMVKDDVINITESVIKSLSPFTRFHGDQPMLKGIKLGIDSYHYKIIIDHDDSSIITYYQAKNDHIKTQAMYAFIVQILKAEFFNQLRTEEQLGYIVHAGSGSLYRLPGIRFIIQSPVLGPSKLLARIDQFLVSYLETLKMMSPEEFEKHRNSILSDLSKRDTRLSERTGRYKSALALNYIEFNHRELLAEKIKKIKKKALVKAYKKIFLSEKMARIVVSNTGNKHTEEIMPGMKKLESIGEFRSENKKYVY